MTVSQMILILLISPLLAGILSLGFRTPKILHGINFVTIVILAAFQFLLTRELLKNGSFFVFHRFFAVDALSLFVLLIVTSVGFTSSIYAWSYLNRHLVQGNISSKRLSRYFFLFHMFMLTMILAILANNLGILWVAIEGTTLATTFLINFFKLKSSLEAGWKYLILCSVGIALALFGTVLMFLSSARALGESNAALEISELIRVAGQLDSHAIKLAFIFILIGYGSKIGWVPMHTWVPEAYAEAPAPVSAMLAGVLETVAFYAVLRVKTVVDAVVPSGFAGYLLILFGFLSFGVAALFILVQRDYKKLFAYSSIEHMGISAIGFGIGSFLGSFGALFHLFNHAISKSLAFFAAGNIHTLFGTREMNKVTGLAKRDPVTALAFLAAGLSLVGMPPFAMFVSEYSVVAALATQIYHTDTFHFGKFMTLIVSNEVRSLALVSLFLLVSLIVFGGFMFRVLGMLWGNPSISPPADRYFKVANIPLLMSIAVILFMGIVLPPSLKEVMNLAVTILVGGRHG
ncbi:MAG: hydrogenase 4 subunit F [Nitrospirae bacterium]|nr:hydrogenase 4 subunit F [Nitrospirota bacterium]MBI3594501.1 hydrogenase 4 subunit F [Nitrospirota bacterium]